MIHRCVATAMLLLLAGCASAPARPARSASPAASPAASAALATAIAARVAQLPGAVAGVAYLDLQTGDSLFLNADDRFHAASTMKVPVMVELMRQVDAGQLALDQPLLLVNEFRSIVDGSPYTLAPTGDSDSSLYARVGTGVPVRELLERMITRSSNLATNALIALAGAERTTATARLLGARDIQVLRGVEDTKAFRAGLSNSTTARDMAAIMSAIERGAAASPASTQVMRDILLRSQHRDEIPAGVPPGTPVANKTGWITGVLHDAALVYARPGTGRRPYVLVVLTRDIPRERDAQQLITDISRLVYAHATRGVLQLPAY
jgi:beta-lactamase class A